jgi:hypothetical protein
MTEPKTLDEALAQLQADPPVLTKNKAGHQSKYADLVQVNAVVLSRLNALGVIWKCRPTLIENGQFVLEYKLLHVASGTDESGRWPLKLSDNPQQLGSAVTYGRRYALLAVTGVAAEDEDDDGGAASGRQYAQRATQQRAASRRTDSQDEPTAQRRTQPPRAGRPPLPGESPDGPVSPEQHRHMHALWRELGYGGDDNRDKRLAITAKILGLPDLESKTDLTFAQADAVIAKLRERKAVQDGAA